MTLKKTLDRLTEVLGALAIDQGHEFKEERGKLANAIFQIEEYIEKDWAESKILHKALSLALRDLDGGFKPSVKRNEWHSFYIKEASK